MTCKTILVHLADVRRMEGLLDAAVPLARANGAHLLALVVIPSYVVMPAADAAGASVTIGEHRTAYKQDMVKMKARFDELGKTEPLSLEWREVDAGFAPIAGVIMDHARSADLVILSKKDPDWAYSGLLEAPDRITIECGRPVIMVPNKGMPSFPPKRVLIAWNGTRESARAAFDAASLLPTGTEITALWVNPDKDWGAGDLPGADLATALARHGFKCDTAVVRAPDGDAGTAIIEEAKARNADLIVMGAYGHTRLREFLLGGASRDILGGMDRPVLMSH